MSTSPPSPPATVPVSNAAPPPKDEVIIISHSNLFYWWPVWAVGYLMALITLFDGHKMAVLPGKPEGHRNVKMVVDGREMERDAIILDQNKKLDGESSDPNSKPEEIKLMVAHSKTCGVIFLTVLLLVIVITNVPLRGMWSVVVIITVFLMAIIFGLAGWWDNIVRYISYLDIRINFGGYIFLSTALLIIWLTTLLFFDRQLYISFTPSQMRVCTEIGGGEQLYDTTGLSLLKERSDLFRHWILGLGSGDLVVKTSGAQAHHFDLANVLFIGRKVRLIEEMLQKRKVIETK